MCMCGVCALYVRCICGVCMVYVLCTCMCCVRVCIIWDDVYLMVISIFPEVVFITVIVLCGLVCVHEAVCRCLCQHVRDSDSTDVIV